METDRLNRRWRKANKKAKGGWCAQAQWHADRQQERLLRREQERETELAYHQYAMGKNG